MTEALDASDLMVRVQNDEAQAFDALYDRFAGRAYRVAVSICHDATRAEDVSQEAFLSAWRSRASYDPSRGSVSSWLMGMVRNRSIDALRRHARHDSRRSDGDHIDEQLAAPGDMEHMVGERDQAEWLRGLLAQLPDAQREVIALAYFGELSASEIARELAIPSGTVKGRMRLGLRSLRTTIDAP